MLHTEVIILKCWTSKASKIHLKKLDERANHTQEKGYWFLIKLSYDLSETKLISNQFS